MQIRSGRAVPGGAARVPRLMDSPGTLPSGNDRARNRRRGRTLCLLLLIVLFSSFAMAPAQAPVVRAVLFFSPTCWHCDEVMREIPGIFDRHGGKVQVWNETDLPQEELAFFQIYNANLEFLLVNVTLTLGKNFYREHTASAGIPDDRLGLPRLAVGGDLLVGSEEFLTQLPAIIEQGLANGGIDWPDIAGLDQIIAAIGSPPATDRMPAEPVDQFTPDTAGPPAAQESEPTPAEEPAVESPSADDSPAQVGTDLKSSPVSTTEAGPGPAFAEDFELAEQDQPTMWERYRLDPVGNTVAILILIGMIVSVPAVVRSRSPAGSGRRLGPVVPILALFGLGVAAYLTYVESTGVAAVCGPVGNCNAVQQSEYARLFGLVPIGTVGLVGYAAIIVTWFVSRMSDRPLATRAVLLLGAITLAGTVFSIYLTFLEPFVIGAACAWCLTSAVIITILMVISVRAAKVAWTVMRSGHQWAGSDA